MASNGPVVSVDLDLHGTDTTAAAPKASRTNRRLTAPFFSKYRLVPALRVRNPPELTACPVFHLTRARGARAKALKQSVIVSKR
jgi:hypothetical protein